MGGSNCAVVGCGCCSSRNKGVTFHTFPKSGKYKETDEWRRRLIHAVSRADKSFNPDRASICSRHFEDSCFVPHGKPCLLFPQLMTCQTNVEAYSIDHDGNNKL